MGVIVKILVTGGAGYIGATIAAAAADAGDAPVILDDFSRGRREFTKDYATYAGDIADPAAYEQVFRDHPQIDLVVHCAARTVVDESIAEPLAYYRENLAKTVLMLELLARRCTRVIFSSSASVYGSADTAVVTEAAPLRPASPYAWTKAATEQLLADLATAGHATALCLRYFNPIGSDPQLRCGPRDPAPTHVLGRLLTAARTGAPFIINGCDWPTRDGTPMRDFVHVWDVAQAHVLLAHQWDGDPSFDVFNLGTGTGTTVRELAHIVAEVTGQKLDIRCGPRRPGDTAGCYADTSRARELVGWQAGYSVTDAVQDAQRWQHRLHA